MAAQLHFTELNRHALPAFCVACLLPPGQRPPPAPGTAPEDPRFRRPRLVAVWRADFRGRMACTWHAGPDYPPG